MPMPSGDPDPNPYAPPSPEIVNRPLPQPRARSKWLFVLCCLQLSVLVGGVVLEAYEHKTIVGSGPVYLIVGLVITWLAARKQQLLEIAVGGSAILLVIGVFLRIVFNDWGPTESDGPNTRVILAYTVWACPALLVAVVRQWQGGPGSELPVVEDGDS